MYKEEKTSSKTLTGHQDAIYSVMFSPDSRLLVSACRDQTLRLWNVVNGETYAKLKGHTNCVSSAAFSPDGNWLVSGSWDKTVRTWSVASKSQAKILKSHSDAVSSVAWSPNGELIASGSHDKTVILWNTALNTEQMVLQGHADQVKSVAFSQDGRKLVSGGNDRVIIIWDVFSGARLMNLPRPESINSVCFSHDDQFVLTAGNDKIVSLFEVVSGRESKQFIGHTGFVSCAAFSFEGSRILTCSGDKSLLRSFVSGGDRSVRMWDVATGKQLLSLPAHGDDVRSVAFSRDGKYFASAGNDHAVRLWSMPPTLQIVPPSSQYTSQYAPKNAPQYTSTQYTSHKTASSTNPKVAELRRNEEETVRKAAEVKQKPQQPPQQQQSTPNVNPDQVDNWTVDDVCAYLQQADIDNEVVAIFRKEKIKGKFLADHAKEETLQSIGITARGDRLEIISLIEKLLPQASSKTALATKLVEIPRNELTEDRELSDGHFGVVYSGKYMGISVAIKKPKLVGADLNAKQQLDDLLEEASVMSAIPPHPNVLQCYGISRGGDQDLWLVVEMCDLGSIEQYLKKHNNTRADVRRDFSLQTARGLNHLSKNNIVHRDIATRNVMLSNHSGRIIAKVADFGLSRLHDGGYYVATGDHLLAPETAPEVKTTGKHSTRSDVWSFGVLLWEVESYCAHRAIPNRTQFPPLPKPQQASDNMYEIMRKCWHTDPHQRPSFEQLIEMLA